MSSWLHSKYKTVSVFFFSSCSPMYSLFVGDITPEVDDGMLYEFFYNRYPSCRAGKVVLDSMGNSKWVLCHHARWRKYFANVRMYCRLALLLPSSKCVPRGYVYMRKSRLTHFSSLHTMKVARLWISAGREFQRVVAPFTLPFECGNHVPHRSLCESFRCGEGWNFTFTSALMRLRRNYSRDGLQLCEWISQRNGARACRSDGVHNLITKQILHSSNKREITHKAMWWDYTEWQFMVYNFIGTS